MAIERRNNPTLHDVAARSGVTVGTASRALDPRREKMVRPETRERIRFAAIELGYQVNSAARGLRKGLSDIVGIIIADFGNPIIAPIIRGIEDVAGGEGFQTLVTETRGAKGGVGRAIEQFVQRRAAAIIVTGVRFEDRKAVENHILRSDIPIAFALREIPGLQVPSVTIDDFEGGVLATRHLLDLGHKRIAELPGPSNASPFVNRSLGFASAMENASGTTIMRVDNSLNLDPTVETGYQLARELFSGNTRPTGVFAHNDLMALGAIEAANEVGLECPLNVSIVGFDNSPLMDHVNPPLTTVRLEGGDLGRRVGVQALQLVQNPGRISVNSKIQPSLVIRASTGRVLGAGDSNGQ